MTTYSRRTLIRMAAGSAAATASVAATTGLGGLSPAFAAAPSQTRYGVNANSPAEVAARLSAFGAVGITRHFYSGMLPTTWDPVKEGSSPNKATQVSFKTSPAAIAAGTYDTVLRSWMTSIPAGWTVYLTFWHEPNDELREGAFTAAEYRAAWSRISLIRRQQVQLQPGVLLRLVPVFMSYLVDNSTGWSDAWVPDPDEVTYVSWDVYGNPSGGLGLGSPYPTPSSCLDPCLRVTSRLGFTKWAVTEFNTPRRSWDPLESARKSWLENFRQYALGAGRTTAPELGSPRFILLWEGIGVNWDQRFATDTTKAWWRGIIASDRKATRIRA